MSWPLPSDFRTMLQNARVAFRDPQLQGCRIERDGLGQPRPWAGAFAVVYKAILPGSQRPVAVRAFSSESPERQQRYDCVGRYLRCRDVPCLVNFEYQDDGIRSAGDGRWYPLVVMEWIEGQTLLEWVRSKCLIDKGPSLAKAARHWLRLVRQLHRAEVAHGDLQHANVMVTRRGQLQLVDYDGMGVPELWGRPNLELGVRPYQHPARDASTRLDPALDRFSSLVIYLALRATAADPSLWRRHVEDTSHDKLLFRPEDFADPDGSALRRELMQSPDSTVPELTDTLFALAAGDPQQVPPLAELVPREAAAASPVAKMPRQAVELDAGAPAVPEAAASVVLEVVSGTIEGRSLTIEDHDTLLFGRGRDCHVRIPRDPRVSRHHFLIEAIPPSARLRDLGSRNGTRVNGRKVGGRTSVAPGPAVEASADAEIELHDGDEIVVGDTTIRVRVELAATIDLPPQHARDEGERAELPAAARASELTLDGLDVLKEIGRGRLGTVCLVRRQADGRQLALKVASPKVSVAGAAAGPILDGMAKVAGLEHPNIVGLLGIGRIRRAYGFLMEYCDQGNLADRTEQQGGKLPVYEAVMLLQQCLDGLTYAHGKELVHGNIKSQNVLLQQDDGRLVARLADFGVARVFELGGLLGMTASVQSQLDHHLMPPERLSGFRRSDPRSDLWALAATFYYAIAGAYPRDGSMSGPLAAVLHEEAVPLKTRQPSVPDPIAAVLDRSLRRKLPERFQTAAQFRAALDAAVQSGGLGLR